MKSEHLWSSCEGFCHGRAEICCRLQSSFSFHFTDSGSSATYATVPLKADPLCKKTAKKIVTPKRPSVLRKWPQMLQSGKRNDRPCHDEEMDPEEEDNIAQHTVHSGHIQAGHIKFQICQNNIAYSIPGLHPSRSYQVSNMSKQYSIQYTQVTPKPVISSSKYIKTT